MKILQLNRANMNGSVKAALDVLVPELREDQERVCGTCCYWNEGALDRGVCESGEPMRTHSAQTCDSWHKIDVL